MGREAVIRGNREAVICNSLGRQPEVRFQSFRDEPRSSGMPDGRYRLRHDFLVEHVALVKFDFMSLLRGYVRLIRD